MPRFALRVLHQLCLKSVEKKRLRAISVLFPVLFKQKKREENRRYYQRLKQDPERYRRVRKLVTDRKPGNRTPIHGTAVHLEQMIQSAFSQSFQQAGEEGEGDGKET